jgi:hypothetical protein
MGIINDNSRVITKLETSLTDDTRVVIYDRHMFIVLTPVACMGIVNDDSRVVNKLEVSLTDDARVIIYNRHMFIVQALVSKNHIERQMKFVKQQSDADKKF